VSKAGAHGTGSGGTTLERGREEVLAEPVNLNEAPLGGFY
jgi:hypothetical protein